MDAVDAHPAASSSKWRAPAAGASGGKAKLCRPTVLTNNLGMPLDIICSAANVHDINFVLPSCKNMKEKGIEMESLIGDKGYISEKIKTFLKDKYMYCHQF